MSARAIIEKMVRRSGEQGTILRIMLFPLYLLSLFYWVIIKVRILLYKNSFLPSYKLPVKVISIGNISVGGTGKTPIALYLAEVLKEMGYKLAILSRGYKSKRENEVTLLSDGEKIFFTPDECGDEPYLLASKLKGIPVLTGKDRYSSGKLASERFNIDIAILDDGFQRLRLKRDLDIILVTPDVLNKRNYLLPRGRLREPMKAIERADIVMVKDGESGVSLPFEKPVFTFKYRPVALLDLKNGNKNDISFIKGKRILAISGIASPEAFFTKLEELGAVVVERLIYPDHHHYAPQDISKIENVSRNLDLIITTEKDGINLKGLIPESLNICVLEIKIEISDEQSFIETVKDLLLLKV